MSQTNEGIPSSGVSYFVVQVRVCGAPADVLLFIV